MDHQTATAALKISAVPPPIVAKPAPTREQLLAACITALDAASETSYDVIPDMEGKAKAGTLGNAAIRKTVFGTMVKAMQKLDPTIPYTMTGFQTAVGATDENAHDIGCWCHEKSEVMLGSVGAERMRMLRDGTLGQYREHGTGYN